MNEEIKHRDEEVSGNNQEIEATHKKDSFFAWIVRLLKGFISGVGAITPGLSGGVMMVVFGIYEPLLKWLANIRQNFCVIYSFYSGWYRWRDWGGRFFGSH